MPAADVRMPSQIASQEGFRALTGDCSATPNQPFSIDNPHRFRLGFRELRERLLGHPIDPTTQRILLRNLLAELKLNLEMQAYKRHCRDLENNTRQKFNAFLNYLSAIHNKQNAIGAAAARRETQLSKTHSAFMQRLDLFSLATKRSKDMENHRSAYRQADMEFFVNSWGGHYTGFELMQLYFQLGSLQIGQEFAALDLEKAQKQYLTAVSQAPPVPLMSIPDSV